MDCIISDGMFLRSNGDLACWCDIGIDKILQHFDSSTNYASDVYMGPIYQYIRDALSENKLPFPEYCVNCPLLRSLDNSNRGLWKERIMSNLLIEPSFACNLSCPSCFSKDQRASSIKKTDGGYLVLNSATIEKILFDLYDGGISIKNIEFHGRGEPLLFENIWDVVKKTRVYFPDSHSMITTNANFIFHPSMEESGLSEIIFAIDGVDQESYVAYRINGNFEKAYQFMKNFSRAVKENHPTNKGTYTIWKYVLFEHNSSKKHLEKLSCLAQEACVDEIKFIITSQGPTSKYFFKTLLSTQELPSNKKFFMRKDAPAEEFSKVAKKYLGYSPFPESLEKNKSFKMTMDFMMSDITGFLNIYNQATKHLNSGRIDEAGSLFWEIVSKLDRIYKGRTDCIIDNHLILFNKIADITTQLPLSIQKEIEPITKRWCKQASIPQSGKKSLWKKILNR